MGALNLVIPTEVGIHCLPSHQFVNQRTKYPIPFDISGMMSTAGRKQQNHLTFQREVVDMST